MQKVQDSNASNEGSTSGSERRGSKRQTVHALAYIDLGPGNGGILRNLSNGGFALTAASKLHEGELPNLRFNLPGIREAIEAQGRIVWLSESKKDAGVAFEKIAATALREITAWVSTEPTLDWEHSGQGRKATVPQSPPVQEGSAPPVREIVREHVAALPAFRAEDGITGPATGAIGGGRQGDAPAGDPIGQVTKPISPQASFEPQPSSSEPPPVIPPIGLGPTASLGPDAGGMALEPIALPADERGPEPKRDSKRSAVVVAVIALISFSAGITIDRRMHRKPTPQSQIITAQAVSGQQGKKSESGATHTGDGTNATAATPSQTPSANTSLPDNGASAVPGHSASEPASDVPATAALTPDVPGTPAREQRNTETPRSSSATTEPSGENRSERRVAKQPSASLERADLHAKRGVQPIPAQGMAQDQKGPDQSNATVMSAENESGPQNSAQKSQNAPAREQAAQNRPQAPQEPIAADKQPGTSPDKTQVTSTTQSADAPVSSRESAKPVEMTGSVTLIVPPFPSIRLDAAARSGQPQQAMSLQMGRLVSRVQPAYPADAISQGVQGTVKVHAEIGPDGAIQNVSATGAPVLADAAKAAVLQWHYQPTLVGGQPVGADEDVVVVFRLSPKAGTSQ